MWMIWGSLAGLLLYSEVVYHVSSYGWSSCNPLYTIFLCLSWSAGITVLVGVLRGRLKKILYYFCIWFAAIWTCVQVVYLRIFKQSLLWEAVFRGGGDALTNYWREALEGILKASPILLLLLIPPVVTGVVVHRKKIVFPNFDFREVLRTFIIFAAGIAGCVVVMQVGKIAKLDYYEDYHEFFNPLTVSETMGVWPMLERDTVLSVERLFEDSRKQSDNTLSGKTDNKIGDEKQTWLAEYAEGLEPVSANEYTGLFEGYNLIFLTAEGFSIHAVSEELTPTLYRLTSSGFQFENYYVPLWLTSTSDGEYINCTGLLPDGQFSMQKSIDNNMAYTLPRFFARDGVQSYAYHNSSLSYYDRYLTHPNMGYDFKGCTLGNLSGEWEDKLFPMENPDAWPASDLEMMQGTIPEYINQERFHVYYLTVSGHLNYNFQTNAMSCKNQEAVAGLELSEAAKAYVACNMELDKALAYLLEQLEAAGKLRNTVICLSADHYPYGLETEQYEELAGESLAEGMDLYRNSLILWNAGMEEESVIVDKACGPMDILPTLLNLFGYSYDSGIYAGRDIFSDEEGMVIFNDRSFVTDGVVYNRKEKNAIWQKDAEGNDIVPDDKKESYLAEKKQEVKNRCHFSSYVLQEDYYATLE